MKAMVPSMRRWLIAMHGQQWKAHAIEKSSFRDLQTAYSFPNLVKAFDLRYWYMDRGINRGQGARYCIEIEDLHNELNHAHGRGVW